MAAGPMNRVVRHLRRAALLREEPGLGDGGLLDRFLQDRDEAAFEALVRRHGPMVWGVCRRLLDNHHDAEDAFQATFLVLARKAASVRPRDLVGNWLYGVAYQTALKARAVAFRRRGREKQVRELPEPPAAAEAASCPDLRPLLDRELARLPDKYRVPIVLCDLEGKTRREAARLLGWPEGTLSGRLARARALLARRLGRRGLTLSGGALAAAVAAESASACVAGPLAAAAVRAGGLVAAGQAAAAGALAPRAAALMEGVLNAMLLTKLKVAAAVLLVAGLVGAGAAGVGREGRSQGPAAAGPSPAAPRPTKDKEGQLFLLRFVDGGTVAGPGRAREKEDVWKLDFTFHGPELRNVTLPGRGKRTVVCLRYEVVNKTGRTIRFIPQIDLQVEGRPVVPDEVLPDAVKRIAAAEDPAGLYRLYDSITIARDPILPFNPARPRTRVHGAALWDTTLPDDGRFSIFVYGLTNAWAAVDAGPGGKPVVLRRVLRLNFRRADGKTSFLPPEQWVYRAVHPRAVPEPQPEDLLKAHQDRQVVERQRAAQQAGEHIARLEKQQQSWDGERDRLRGLLRAWQEAAKEGAHNDEAPDRHKLRQALVRDVEQFLAAGEEEARRRAVDLELLRRRLAQVEKHDRQAGAAEDLGGKVQEVDGKLLLLSFAREHAVTRGERLEVYRVRPQPVYLGQAEVVTVVGSRAVARLTRSARGQAPRPGDSAGRMPPPEP